MTESNQISQPITSEQKELLEELAVTTNEKLITAGQDSANRAFNVGCTVGLLPALLLIGLTLLITRGSWIATALISGLMIMGLLAFANLSALISRSRAYDRMYQQELSPEIEEELQKFGVDRFSFERITAETIPPGAPLRAYIAPEPINDAPIDG